MNSARLTVCVGGGGVGKTTTAAALALHLAREGARTLVITVDPARRLADALGIAVGPTTSLAQICPRAHDRLFANMPDPRASTGLFMHWLFEDPKQRARVQENPAYHELADSLAGMHELVALSLLEREAQSGRFDEIVLDTAPSRNALAFLSYPSRLLELLEAKTLTWLSALAPPSDGASTTEAPKPSRLWSWSRNKVEQLFGRVVGLTALRNLSLLFGDLVSVRQRWAQLVHETENLLRHATTRYLLVGAPTGGAIADLHYLDQALERRGLRSAGLVLNRAFSDNMDHVRELELLLSSSPLTMAPEATALLQTALHQMRDEHEARRAATARAEQTFAQQVARGIPIIRLPRVDQPDSKDIVLALADAWEQAARL